ncbi:MAG: response regulator transcription factor [Prevotella sp.]|nr:response regulator transcription factor [Prevotella sp.]
MMKRRILVVDDEEDLREILKFNLEKEGYEVDTAASSEEALDLDLASYDIMLLDIMMGEISGMALAAMLKRRRETASIPIIFITARDKEDDTVKGLSMGADDYIIKPFRIREVAARVEAVLRRSGNVAVARREGMAGTVSFEGLFIDTAAKRVTVDGADVALTKKEFEILLLLAGNAGRVFSRQDILSRVWDDDVYVLDRTVDVNITRLRKKIGHYGDRIRTRQGYGYSFDK